MRIRCLTPLLLASVMVLTSMSQCRKEDPGQVSNRVQARIDGIMYGRGNESYTSGRRPVLTGSEEGFRFQFSTTLYPAGVEDTDELRREEVTLKLYVRGENLLCWDSIKVMDPENTGTRYPITKAVHVGIMLNF